MMTMPPSYNASLQDTSEDTSAGPSSSGPSNHGASNTLNAVRLNGNITDTDIVTDALTHDTTKVQA